MKGTIPKNRGFTLVEMLVVIFIIGIISTILIVNWRKNENQYKLQRAAQEIAFNIRKAQEMALNGRKCSDGEVPNSSFGVNFDNATINSYTIFCDRNDNNMYQTPSADLFVETISIESGIIIHSLSSGAQDLDIAFSLPDSFTVINPQAASPATITIKKTGATCPSVNCKNIIVKKTGEISID